MPAEQLGELLAAVLVLFQEAGEFGRFAAITLIDGLLRLEATKTILDLSFARDNHRRRILARTQATEAEALKTMLEAVKIANEVRQTRTQDQTGIPTVAPPYPPREARREAVADATAHLVDAVRLLAQHGGAIGIDVDDLKARIDQLAGADPDLHQG